MRTKGIPELIVKKQQDEREYMIHINIENKICNSLLKKTEHLKYT